MRSHPSAWWLAGLSLAGCAGAFDRFREESPLVNAQIAFVSTATPEGEGPGRLLLLNLDGSATDCGEGRPADELIQNACVLYDATPVMPSATLSLSRDRRSIAFSAQRGVDVEVFVTGVDGPLSACPSGEAPLGGACGFSQNPAGPDLDPFFGVDASGIEAVFFQGSFLRDTDGDGALSAADRAVPDLASSSGVSPVALTFAQRGADLDSLPSAPILDRERSRLLLSISGPAGAGIFFLASNGTAPLDCGGAEPVLGACPLVDSALEERGAAPQPLFGRLYLLREDAGGGAQIAFVEGDGSAPADCPAPSIPEEGACVIVSGQGLGLPSLTDDGLFLLFSEADPRDPARTRLRLSTLLGETPAGCLTPFRVDGEACVLDAPAGSLRSGAFLPLSSPRASSN